MDLFVPFLCSQVSNVNCYVMINVLPKSSDISVYLGSLKE